MNGHREHAGRWKAPGAAWIVGCWFSAVALGAAPPQGADPAKAIKSKVVAERLAAVEALRKSTDPQAEKLLLSALADKDFEVEARACAALGERGGEGAWSPLVRECIDGPIRHIRAAAARALAQVAPERGSAELAKLCAGKSAQRALEALAVVGRARADDSVAPAVLRALKAKEFPLRLAAAGSIPCLPEGAAATALKEVLALGDAEIGAAALDAVAASGEAHFLEVLLPAFAGGAQPDTLERRFRAAIAACLRSQCAAGAGESAAAALEKFATSLKGPEAEAQAARLFGVLAREPLDRADFTALRAAFEPRIVAGLGAAGAHVRKASLAAALRAVQPLGREEVLALGAKDPDPMVRALALRELTRAFGARDEALLSLLLDRLAGDVDPRVREEAAVALGIAGVESIPPALGRALGDPQWPVATCAAVSLGKTRGAEARGLLEGELTQADWRRRASAVVGLTWLWDKAPVPALIRALADEDGYVKKCAHAFLVRELRVDLAADRGAWEAWWKENEPRVRLVDPQVLKERREKYGYASRAAEVYTDLDVVVLESRGDHIERLLERLKIGHRRTQAAKLAEAGLHPGAIYVSNCTGEVEDRDVERIAWYVRSGGVLFGSCWSLTETIARAHPGVIRKFESSGDVLDDVEARAVDASSSYLKQVFGEDVEPLYHLEGSHLITVDEPEFCEVLIDSPQAQKRWGAGNLAAWFSSGHGRILDSANHFELQGLEVAPGLRTAEDRIAFAFDRLGIDFETWRRTQGEKWWDSALKASQNVFDYSALNFVTNFVREKRLSDG